jgi:hypothetical protein
MFEWIRRGMPPVVGGPALFLLGENLFEWRTTGRANVKRLAAAGLIVGLVPLASHVSALVLATVITVLLSALAVWELRASPSLGWAPRHRAVGPKRTAAAHPMDSRERLRRHEPCAAAPGRPAIGSAPRPSSLSVWSLSCETRLPSTPGMKRHPSRATGWAMARFRVVVDREWHAGLHRRRLRSHQCSC